MNASEKARSHSTGPSVHVAADDRVRHACMIAPLNIQYRHNLQLTSLIREPLECQALVVILPNIQYSQYFQATPLMRELLGCQALQRAEAVHSVRVGNRHGASTKPREVVTGVISRPARVPSPGNRQTVHGDRLCDLANQTDRVAPGGCGWRRTHPPPWLFQYTSQRPMSASLAL